MLTTLSLIPQLVRLWKTALVLSFLKERNLRKNLISKISGRIVIRKLLRKLWMSISDLRLKRVSKRKLMRWMQIRKKQKLKSRLTTIIKIGMRTIINQTHTVREVLKLTILNFIQEIKILIQFRF